MARRREVGPARVREWAQAEGKQVGERGRFSAELLEEFHNANKRERYTKGKVEGQRITGVRVTESGRKVPVTVTATMAEVRAFAKAQGLDVGERGRISAEVKAQFAATPRA